MQLKDLGKGSWMKVRRGGWRCWTLTGGFEGVIRMAFVEAVLPPSDVFSALLRSCRLDEALGDASLLLRAPCRASLLVAVAVVALATSRTTFTPCLVALRTAFTADMCPMVFEG